MENTSVWHVEVKHLETGALLDDTCDILINAGGYLNNWRWPDTLGMHEFKGKLIHTSNWDESVRLEDKRVGLIGNGCVSIPPELSKMY